jgi:hypothetical protein
LGKDKNLKTTNRLLVTIFVHIITQGVKIGLKTTRLI